MPLHEDIHYSSPLISNPLDYVEDLLNDNNWVYTRMNDDQLCLDITGKQGRYSLLFYWNSQLNTLQLVCEYDLSIHPENQDAVYKAIAQMNSLLCVGHFEVISDSDKPYFRHSGLLPHTDEQICYRYIEDFVELSLAQCEQHYPLFYVFSQDHAVTTDTLAFLMTTPVGNS